VGDRNYGYFARTRGSWVRPHSQHNLLTCGLVEKAVNIIRPKHFTPIHGEQILAWLYVHAGFRQRSVQFGIPVLSAIDLREPVPPILNRIISAEQTDLNFRHLRYASTSDKHVSNGHIAQHFAKQKAQVVAARDAGEIRFKLLLGLLQIQAMEIRSIEEIAL